MISCYLTIDDSPSPHTDAMVDFLLARDIPALFFVRGDLTEANPDPIIRAIQNGFVIGNHSYAHKPFGHLSYDEAIADIDRCDVIIDQCYAQAGITRPGRYFRFPYLDRGDGDRIERHFEMVSDDDINAQDRVQALQSYLKNKGFCQPFQVVTHPLYHNPSICGAADCLMTFTSYDWMLTDRHVGQWDFKTIDDLKSRIDQDAHLSHAQGNILIFHDQDETFVTFKSLIDHMCEKEYRFLSFQK